MSETKTQSQPGISDHERTRGGTVPAPSPMANVGHCRTATFPARDPSLEFAWLYTTIVGSLLLRLTLLDYESGDYRAFLLPWYDLFIQHGRWHAFQAMDPPSVYPPLYMYLLSLSTFLPLSKLYAIKLISITSDYVAAWFLWRIVRRGSPAPSRSWAATTALLFLPTVVMNGALWGQCDAMYTACLLASLLYLLEHRCAAALVAFGFACSLKPQAIFWCPLLAGLCVSGRVPWRLLWIPAAVYLGCGLPAVLAGWPFVKMLFQMMVYVSGGPRSLTLGATNWYQWVFEQQREIFYTSGVVLTVVATVFLALWMQERPKQGLSDPQWLISMALLSVLFPPFFLPSMHERYFFAADVISLAYAACLPQGLRVAVLIQFASAFTYLPYLFEKEPVPRWFLPLAIMAAMVLVVRKLGAPSLTSTRGIENDHLDAGSV
jgi:Gpi18-like mannosyltransferase